MLHASRPLFVIAPLESATLATISSNNEHYLNKEE